jgi:hypothetical protein
MYLGQGKYGSHYVGTEQRHSRAPFLVLMVTELPNSRGPGKPLGERSSLRAAVRQVAMHQLGHFMMARARIGSRMYSLSGTYGSDGLPLSVDYDDWLRGEPVPPELEAKFWKSEGHNAAGAEGPDFYRWGRTLAAKAR